MAREQIWIEGARGRFDKFRRIEVATDIFGEAQAWFEVADDRAWRTLRPLLAPSSEFRIYCNGFVVFTGRVDCNELPVSVDEGTVIQVVMRTRLADTRLGSADNSVRVADTSIKAFILALYARHGLLESDFLFTADADRALVTGRKAGRLPPVDLEPFKADQAKVLATETTEAAAKRHLERHHLMLWDGGGGQVCVGLPDDQQRPLYRFTQSITTGACNFREAHPVRDWGELPSSVAVYGGGVGKDIKSAKFVGIARDYDLTAVADSNAGVFRRRVTLQVEGAKDLARANAQARRELAARSRRKAAWEVTADDWSQGGIPFAIATTCEMDTETHEGSDLRGVFLVTSVRKRLDVDGGTSATLTMIAQGLLGRGDANP